VLLCGKIDDIAWTIAVPDFGDEHGSDGDFASLAGFLVGLEVVGMVALELQGDPFAHYTDAVDGIYKRFSVGLQEVATSVGDQLAFPSR
jgi:hypothetical protein